MATESVSPDPALLLSTLAKPKSHIFKLLFFLHAVESLFEGIKMTYGLMSKFSGLMSLWITLLRWQYSMAFRS